MRNNDEYSFVKVQTNKDFATLRWVGSSMNYTTEVSMFVNDKEVPAELKEKMHKFTIG